MRGPSTMPEVGRGGLDPPRAGSGAGRGRGRGGWGMLRTAVKSDGGGNRNKGRDRRPNLLNTMKMTSFRFSQRHVVRGERATDTLPEEGGDVHKHFRTCASLTRIREEFHGALDEDAEKKMGFGLNVCARPEEITGRLLLHSIGLNSDLITSGGGGTAAAQSRVNQFVLKELLPAFPSAIIEEDDKGRIPFTEPIAQWIEARRAVRKWKVDTDRTREKVALVAAKLKRKMKSSQPLIESDSDDSSADGRHLHRLSSGRTSLLSLVGQSDQKQARSELKMIVESCDDAMFCIDEKGKILLTNNAACKQFGYPKRELKGNNIKCICNEKDAARHGSYLERYLRTGEKRVMGKKRELLARRKDGTTFYIELGLTEINLGGGKFIFAGFVKDITDLKNHRRSLEYAHSSLNDSAAKLDVKQAKKEEGPSNNSRARGIPPLVEWCLTILSEFVDNYGYKSDSGRADGGGGDDDDDSSCSSLLDFGASFTNLRAHKSPELIAMRDTMVVEKVASIPHLLEELLLIEDTEARSRVFDMSIVHKVLFTTDSLGNGKWLIDMLDKSIRVQKQKILDANLTGADLDTAEGRAMQLQLRMAQDQCRFLAEGVIFYLERVSELNIQDDLYVFHHVQMHQEVTHNGGMADMISTGDVHHFQKHREELFDAVGGLNGLVRRICVLEDDLVKRAAATPLIRRLLDKIMFSPFAMLAALFDGMNHFLLMISFRLGPAPALFHLSKTDETFQPHQYLLASVTLMATLAYFGTKAIHAGLAKHALSENLFWSDAFTFWNLLDTVPLLMALLCSIAVDIVLRARAYAEVDDSEIPFFLRTVIAITTPFLWLRIMAFIKVYNKQLATFILCTVEIMKDIKWFLLVLFAAMAAFAQMWVSFTFEPNQSESQYYMEGYLKAYTMMLGDLDSDALRSHPLIAVLFVLYTFGVTIVLLNILIAIVSDSYQNSFSSSKMMLGKARVMFASELLSQKTFHQMWMEGKAGTIRRNVNYVFLIVAVLHVWMLTRTVNAKLGQGPFCEMNILSPSQTKLEATLIFLVLFTMLVAMKKTMAYVLNEFNDTGALKSPLQRRTSSRLQRAIVWFVKNVFSALSNSIDSLFDREDTQQELGGNSPSRGPDHRTDNAIQRSIEKTRKTLKAELKSMIDQLQISLREMEEHNKQDMTKFEESISTIHSAISESQHAMVEALQMPEFAGSREPSLNEEDEGEISSVENDISDGSESSLSAEDVGKLS